MSERNYIHAVAISSFMIGLGARGLIDDEIRDLILIKNASFVKLKDHCEKQIPDKFKTEASLQIIFHLLEALYSAESSCISYKVLSSAMMRAIRHSKQKKLHAHLSRMQIHLHNHAPEILNRNSIIPSLELAGSYQSSSFAK